MLRERFIQYIQFEKRFSSHTVISYQNDLNQFFSYLEQEYQTYNIEKVDHFNWQDSANFQQKYFVDESYWSRKADAPVFLCVGGEGPPLDPVIYSTFLYT